MTFTIKSESPNDKTHDFLGYYVKEENKNELSIENILLRGTTIHNIGMIWFILDYVIGAVLYTGKETKSEYSSSKSSDEKVTLQLR